MPLPVRTHPLFFFPFPLPFLDPIDKPSEAVDAENTEAINVGSKSSIFLPDGGSQYDKVNIVPDHSRIVIFTASWSHSLLCSSSICQFSFVRISVLSF